MVPERSQARANPARGIALIATAVIVGIFLFRSGWDSPDSAGASGASGGPQVAGQSGDGEGEDPAQTTTTLPQPRAAGEVTVLVLNASGVGGAAGEQSNELATQGYVMAEAGNAPEGTDPAATIVYFVPEYQPEATVVAQQIGAPATAVQPLPNPVPFDPAGAHVIVVLGSDLANA